MTFYPYWYQAVKAVLKTHWPAILAGAFRQDNRLQVFVFNPTAETREGVQSRWTPPRSGCNCRTARAGGRRRCEP